MAEKLSQFFLRLFILCASGIVRLLWIGSISGREKMPSSPCVFVANHASYLDFLLLGYLFYYLENKPMHFWAKTKVIKHPLWRFFSRLFSPLEVDVSASTRNLMAVSIECLEKGVNICIFPEGTRTRTGEIQKFKTGYLSLAKATKVRVVSVLLENTHRAWPPDKWFPRLRKCNIRLVDVYTLESGMSKSELESFNTKIRDDLIIFYETNTTSG